MRADNHGEGGILALLALVDAGATARRRARGARRCSLLGLFGAALLYGDGMITPAISVLGAVEGLEVATPALRAAASSRSRRDPDRRCSCVQRRGTGGIGARLRPGHAGLVRRDRARSALPRIVRAPGDPRGASTRATPCASSSTHGCHGFLVLGSVVLVHHRRRGALRRHGPLRPRADPPRLVRARAARRCCSTTSARARCCSSDPAARQQPVLRAGARLGCSIPLVGARHRWPRSSPRRR